MTPFLEGVIAGYAIAIPVGPIAILIIDTGLRGGFRPGFAAGAGAASADLTYAALAAIAGAALATLIQPYELPLKIISAIVLIGLGAWGLWRLLSTPARGSAQPQTVESQPAAIGGAWQTYVKFLGLTLINPLTVVYFAALIVGGGAKSLDTLDGRALFVLGAGLSSLSWQSLLAGIGAAAHRHLPPRFQTSASVIGNLVVIGLGLRIAAGLILGGA